jgi:acetyl-CoA carboxylase biotin carboxylase subunit
VINYDLIKEQIKIAMGEKITGEDYFRKCIPLNAASMLKILTMIFAFSGRITSLNQPGGHGFGLTAMHTLVCHSPYYDSMIGKLITVARTRNEAIDTMYRALSEYVIEGVKTTIPFIFS